MNRDAHEAMVSRQRLVQLPGSLGWFVRALQLHERITLGGSIFLDDYANGNGRSPLNDAEGAVMIEPNNLHDSRQEVGRLLYHLFGTVLPGHLSLTGRI
jgi:hypothetical protein